MCNEDRMGKKNIQTHTHTIASGNKYKKLYTEACDDDDDDDDDNGSGDHTSEKKNCIQINNR